jgi:hypothetical protein
MNGQSSCEDNRRSVCGCAKTVKWAANNFISKA